MAGGRPVLGAVHRYRAADHAGLASAWGRFAADIREKLPDAASIAVAAPLGEAVLRFVNSDWTIDTRTLQADLGVGKSHILNDFGAMAYGVSSLRPEELVHIHGPAEATADQGVISIIGPGTGLGVAMLVRRGTGLQVIETEGAHIAFAPLDARERVIAEHLASRFGRVSVERVASGPGLADIASAISSKTSDIDDIAAKLWESAIQGRDPVAVQALDHFIAILGSAVGDLALAHGSNAVVLTGGIVNRTIDRLRSPLFVDRFRAKGRYTERMSRIPIKVATNLDAGLLGAAVAFTRAG